MQKKKFEQLCWLSKSKYTCSEEKKTKIKRAWASRNIWDSWILGTSGKLSTQWKKIGRRKEGL